MNIIISNTSGLPIYEQIHHQIKTQVISGALSAGEALPSIRALAKDLRVSVITTKRAYEELERDGYIHTVAGKGSFVAARNEALIREEHLRTIEEHIQAILDLAAPLGLGLEEIFEMFRTLGGDNQ